MRIATQLFRRVCRMNQRKHVGALREFNSEQIGFSIWRGNFINNIAAVQHQRTIFDNAHVLVSELQSIGLNRRELERDQAAFPIWVFGGTDKTRTSRFSTPPYCRTIKLSHLRNATGTSPCQYARTTTVQSHHRQSWADPTDSHQDNLAMVNSSTGGCGSCDSFWLCEPALRITRLYILRANVPRSAFPVSAMLIAAARRQPTPP